MARIIGAVYNGLIWASVITLLCVNSVVICMRINMGTLFLISFVGTAALLWIISFLKKWKIGALFSILNLAACGLAITVAFRLIYNKDLLTRPAFILQLALHRQAPPQELVNGVILAVLAGGYLVVLAADLVKKRKGTSKKDR